MLLSVCNGRSEFCHVHNICGTTHIVTSAEHIGVGEKRVAVESLQIITISQNIQEELSLTTARACFTQGEQEGVTLYLQWHLICMPMACFLTNRPIYVYDKKGIDWGVITVLPYSINPALKQIWKNINKNDGFIHTRSLKQLVYKAEKEQHLLHPAAAPDQLYPSSPLGPRPNHSLTFTHLASGTYKTCTSYLSPTDSSLYTGIWREKT